MSSGAVSLQSDTSLCRKALHSSVKIQEHRSSCKIMPPFIWCKACSVVVRAGGTLNQDFWVLFTDLLVIYRMWISKGINGNLAPNPHWKLVPLKYPPLCASHIIQIFQSVRWFQVLSFLVAQSEEPQAWFTEVLRPLSSHRPQWSFPRDEFDPVVEHCLSSKI